MGVIIDQKLNFNENTDKIMKNCLKKWSILKRFCKNANGSIFLKLYLTYILPNIEYCNSIWKLNETHIKPIESIQRKCTKFICNKLCKYDYNYDMRCDALGLKTLDSRRKIKILCKVYSFIKSPHLVPNELINCFEVYSNRNGLFIKMSKIRIKFCDKNFVLYGIELFNNLPMDIRNLDKFSLFKSHIIKYFN